jgi:hypothetical protein
MVTLTQHPGDRSRSFAFVVGALLRTISNKKAICQHRNRVT